MGLVHYMSRQANVHAKMYWFLVENSSYHIQNQDIYAGYDDQESRFMYVEEQKHKIIQHNQHNKLQP